MKTQMRFGLEEPTVDKIGSVFKRHSEIEKVIIYGSRALGTHREGSDIDLMIIAPTLTTDDLSMIEDQIDDLMLPYKFDISLFHQIDNQNLIKHIDRVGKQFWPCVGI